MKDKIELLTRIARFLILRGSFTGNIGLLQGKLGICIFFYRYARFTGKQHYFDFANNLIDEIYDEICLCNTKDFRDGLAHYVLGRCFNKESRLFTTKEYIADLIESMQKNQGSEELIHQLINLKEDRKVRYSFDILDRIANKSKWKKDDLPEKHTIGISDNGLTGIAINLLNKIEP